MAERLRGRRQPSSTIQLLPTVFATDLDGAYTIDGVPTGRHTLRFRHEQLGEWTREVEVSADAAVREDLAIAPPAG